MQITICSNCPLFYDIGTDIYCALNYYPKWNENLYEFISKNCKLESINCDCKAFIPERREV
jgi:hypothetical protein